MHEDAIDHGVTSAGAPSRARRTRREDGVVSLERVGLRPVRRGASPRRPSIIGGAAALTLQTARGARAAAWVEEPARHVTN